MVKSLSGEIFLVGFLSSVLHLLVACFVSIMCDGNSQVRIKVVSFSQGILLER